MTRFPLFVAMFTWAATAATAQIDWETSLYDPGPDRSDVAAADLVLPMPCGGAMAFERVTIPMDATNPLADIQVRLGQSGSSAGYLDYLRNDSLRGGFADIEGTATYFYIGRYELTDGQHKALTSFPECDFTPGRRDIVGKGGLSWFDAINLSQIYTEWLHENHEDAMPQEDGQKSYVRLPTEVEWEYAARGGAAVSPGEFSGVRFPMEDPVDAYARFDSERPGPVGIKKPNPLSLFDMYGNLEEIVFEPFRLNSVGQTHGQVGGMVVRGGSFQRSESDMRSSNRKEWPFYNRRGVAQAQDSFGVRFVLSVHVGTSDVRVREISDAWTSAFESDPADGVSAASVLSDLIEGELDPLRKSNLENVLVTLTEADERAKESQQQQLEVTMQSVATFLWQIWRAEELILQAEALRKDTKEYLDEFRGELHPEDIEILEERIVIFDDRIIVQKQRQRLAMEAFRQALEFVAAAPAENRDVAAGIVNRRLQEAGSELVDALEAFVRDIPDYMIKPDMSFDELLDLANTR